MEIGHKRIKNLMILKSNQVQSSRYLFLSLDLYHNTAIEIGRNRIKALYDIKLLAPSGALIAIPTYYWPTSTPLFQITPVLNTGLSLSEPLQLYKGYNAI